MFTRSAEAGLLLLAQAHKSLEHLVRCSDDTAVGLEAALGRDHSVNSVARSTFDISSAPVVTGATTAGSGRADIGSTGSGSSREVVLAGPEKTGGVEEARQCDLAKHLSLAV